MNLLRMRWRWQLEPVGCLVLRLKSRSESYEAAKCEKNAEDRTKSAQGFDLLVGRLWCEAFLYLRYARVARNSSGLDDVFYSVPAQSTIFEAAFDRRYVKRIARTKSSQHNSIWQLAEAALVPFPTVGPPWTCDSLRKSPPVSSVLPRWRCGSSTVMAAAGECGSLP